jgi:hypothetical protein
MDLCAFHRHGARRSREAKPSLPTRGADGIPLDHELEFELLLYASRSVPLRRTLKHAIEPVTPTSP